MDKERRLVLIPCVQVDHNCIHTINDRLHGHVYATITVYVM